MNAVFLMLLSTLFLPQLPAALAGVAQFALLEKAPRLAVLPPITTALAAVANLHLLSAASGTAAVVWLFFLLCAAYAFLGTLVGLGVGTVRHIQKRRILQ